MTARYSLSIEHSEVRRLFLEQENAKGGVEAFLINLQDQVPTVWNAPPEGEFKAHKIEYKGFEGFIFMNPNDNYARYDFYTEEYLAKPPEFIAIETPESTRQQSEIDRANEKRLAQKTAQAEQEKKIQEYRDNLIKERYENCLELNRKVGQVFDVSDFESFYKKESKSNFFSSEIPLLSAIRHFEDRYGKSPELVVPVDVSTNAKLNELRGQLQREEFLNTNGFHLKMEDHGKQGTISVFDANENLISFMRAPWEKNVRNLEFYTDSEFEKTDSSDVACYSLNLEEALHVEYGKKADFDDLKFPELFEILTDIEFAQMRSEDWDIDRLANDLPIYDMDNYDNQDIMELLMEHAEMLEKVRGVIMTTPAPAMEKPDAEEALMLN